MTEATRLFPSTEPDTIGDLKQEIETLRLLLAAKHIDEGTGIFTAGIPAKTSMAQVDRFLQGWRELWAQRRVSPPPPLLPILGDVEIRKLEYNGSGLFCLRVPEKMSQQTAMQVAHIWHAAWAKTGTPNPAMIIVPDDLDITKMSDLELQVLGLMRIPTELSTPG